MSEQPLVKKIRQGLVHPELRFKILGYAFDVYNTLGYGYVEKEYQKALAISFRKNQIPFKEQVYFPLRFENMLLKKAFVILSLMKKLSLNLKKRPLFKITY